MMTINSSAVTVPSIATLAPPKMFLDLEKYDRTLMRERFIAAEPFNHITIDNFLRAEPLAEAERQLRAMPERQWHDNNSPDAAVNDCGDIRQQTKKVALANLSLMPDLVRLAMEELQSPAFLQFLTDVTGIEELHVDPSKFGAGVHRVQHGGHLTLHADFNVHSISGRYRRLNVLIYLNSDWEPSHQGQLELWPRDLSACAHALPPVFNRMVLFRITDDAIHGHPHPWRAPPGMDRLSLALYYYTDDRPAAEKTPTHFGAVWYPDTMDACTTFSGRIDAEALAALATLRSVT